MTALPPQADDSESPTARINRNVGELLQELRVAQAGVQILFAFLLGMAFTPVFMAQPRFIRWLHLAAVLFAAAAAGFLIAPASWHRVLFRQRKREAILRHGSQFAKFGIASLAVSMALTVGVIGYVTLGPAVALVSGIGAAAAFFGLWFVYPTQLSHDETS